MKVLGEEEVEVRGNRRDIATARTVVRAFIVSFIGGADDK